MEDWEIQNSICEKTVIHYQDLDNFGTKLDMLNEILRGHLLLFSTCELRTANTTCKAVRDFIRL